MNKLKHHFLGGLVFLGTISFGYIGYSAYTSLSTQTDGAVITKDIWNNVINTVNTIGNKTDFLEAKISNIYQSGGNIGIGTSNPNKMLHLKGIYPYIGFEDSEDPNGSIGTITSYQNGYMYYDANNNNSATLGGHYFRADGGTKYLMALTNNGNVGIGTTNPQDKLQVNGSISDVNISRAITLDIGNIAVTANAENYIRNLSQLLRNNSLPNGTYIIRIFMDGNGSDGYWRSEHTAVIPIRNDQFYYNNAPSEDIPVTSTYHHRTVAKHIFRLNSNGANGNYGDLCLYAVPATSGTAYRVQVIIKKII